MDRAEVATLVDAERVSLAALLDELSPQEWEQPSLAQGWRVRDVVAHLTLSTRVRPLPAMIDFVRARGSFNRLVHDTAVRKAQTPTSQLVDEIRQMVGDRRLPPRASYLEPLADTLVHGQDIARPLGRDRPMPPAAAVVAADRVWTMGWPFHSQRRLAGLRLRATDVDWHVGAGDEVSGPIGALLLLLTGRPAGLPELTGDGLPALRAQLARA